MRRLFDNPIVIGLSDTEATLVSKSSAWYEGVLNRNSQTEVSMALLGSNDADTSDINSIAKRVHTMLDGLLDNQKHLGAPIRIVLADSWARFWMVTPPSNASNMTDLKIAASARFSALFGDSAVGWQIDADFDVQRPFLACAIPHWLLLVLNQVTEDRKMVLTEVSTQFVVSWNVWRRKLQAKDWFGVMHKGRLSYAVVDDAGLRAIGAINLSAEVISVQQCLSELLMREALRLNLDLPAKIKLCGDVPSHWVMQAIDTLTFERLARIAPTNAKAQPSLTLALSGGPA